MVSQFVSSHQKKLLGDLNFDFPEHTHAIGRLDEDSEGLLLLTTDKRITKLLFLDAVPHLRTYLVMVQNNMTSASLKMLEDGIEITIKGAEKYLAKPLKVEEIQDPFLLYNYASDNRTQYPHTWLCITLAEGKYRQVRKMVLAVRHRCLRLVRLSISNMELENLAPGEVKELTGDEFYNRLQINIPKT